jgi:hypothetical protein
MAMASAIPGDAVLLGQSVAEIMLTLNLLHLMSKSVYRTGRINQWWERLHVNYHTKKQQFFIIQNTYVSIRWLWYIIYIQNAKISFSVLNKQHDIRYYVTATTRFLM